MGDDFDARLDQAMTEALEEEKRLAEAQEAHRYDAHLRYERAFCGGDMQARIDKVQVLVDRTEELGKTRVRPIFLALLAGIACVGAAWSWHGLHVAVPVVLLVGVWLLMWVAFKLGNLYGVGKLWEGVKPTQLPLLPKSCTCSWCRTAEAGEDPDVRSVTFAGNAR